VGTASSNPPSRGILLLALVTTWLTTGGNFIAFKNALEAFPLGLLMAMRLFLASALLLAVALIIRAPWPTFRQVRAAVAAGALLLVIGQGAIMWGVQHLPAGRTAVFASSAPLFVAIFSIFAGEMVGRRKALGIGLGIVGLGIMTLMNEDGGPAVAPVLVVLGGSAAWALGSIYACRADLSESPVMSGGIQTLSAGLIVLPMMFVLGDFRQADLQASTTAWLSLAYLAALGLALGFSLFAWLDRVSSPTAANSFHYMSPLVALVAGALLLGETISLGDILGSSLALLGVVLMVSGSERPEKARKGV